MKRLFKVFAVIGVANLVILIINIFCSKYRAVLLKPEGVGIFSQAMMFSGFSIPICFLGIAEGVQKYVAQFKASHDRENLINTINLALWIAIIVGTCYVVSVLVFSRCLSGYLLWDEKFYFMLIIYSVGVPFAALSELLASIFVGYGNYTVFGKIKVINALMSVIPIIILIYFYGIKGAFIQYLISSIIGLIVYVCYVKKVLPPDLISLAAKSFFKIDVRFFKTIARYGFVGLMSVAISHFTMLFLRSDIISQFGVQTNGYYQVIKVINSYLFSFVSSGIIIYFMPRLSSLFSENEINVEINKTIRFGFFIILPVCFLLIIYKKLFILLFFTKEFLPSSSLFTTQLVGEMFYLIFTILTTSLMARRRLKMVVVSTVLFNVLFVLFYYLLSSSCQLKAITLSFLFTSFLCVIVNLAYHKFDVRFRLNKDCLKIILLSFALISVPIFFTVNKFLHTIYYWPCLAIWFYFVLTKDEYQIIKKQVLNYVKR